MMAFATSGPVIPSFGGGGSSFACERANHLFCTGWVSRNWSRFAGGWACIQSGAAAAFPKPWRGIGIGARPPANSRISPRAICSTDWTLAGARHGVRLAASSSDR